MGFYIDNNYAGYQMTKSYIQLSQEISEEAGKRYLFWLNRLTVAKYCLNNNDSNLGPFYIAKSKNLQHRRIYNNQRFQQENEIMFSREKEIRNHLL